MQEQTEGKTGAKVTIKRKSRELPPVHHGAYSGGYVDSEGIKVNEHGLRFHQWRKLAGIRDAAETQDDIKAWERGADPAKHGKLALVPNEPAAAVEAQPEVEQPAVQETKEAVTVTASTEGNKEMAEAAKKEDPYKHATEQVIAKAIAATLREQLTNGMTLKEVVAEFHNKNVEPYLESITWGDLAARERPLKSDAAPAPKRGRPAGSKTKKAPKAKATKKSGGGDSRITEEKLATWAAELVAKGFTGTKGKLKAKFGLANDEQYARLLEKVPSKHYSDDGKRPMTITIK